ncbi:MAG: two-component regulator propeller domain-containing protein [Bacteroidota bacterium]
MPLSISLFRYLPVLFIGVCFLSAPAQTNLQGYDLFTTRSGLSHNHVISVAQDHDGYLWVGTRSGLSRFDGQEFISYTGIIDSLRNSLGNAIEAISCQQDRIWIGTRNGLLTYLDIKTGKWHKIKLPSSVHQRGFGIKTIFVKNGFETYAGTSEGDLIIINEHTGECKIRKVAGYQIRSITALNDEILIYADKVYRYAKGNLSLVNVGIPIPLWPAAAVNRNILMINSEKGGYIFYDLLTHKIIHTSDKKESKSELAIIRATRDHFITTDGNTVSIYNLDGTRENVIYIDENEIRDKWELINNLAEDQQGNIWIAMDHGLVKIVQSKHRFNHFYSNNRFRKLSHNYVRSLYAEGNTVWVGTWHGRINRLFIPPGQQKYVASSYPFKKTANTSTINAITRLNNGTLVAAGPVGLFRLNGTAFEPYPLPFKNMPPLVGDLWMVKQDKRGWIWISSQRREGNRLYILDEKRHLLRLFPHNAMIWNMLEDKNGNTWLATEEGLELAHIDPVTGQITFEHHTRFARNAPGGIKMWSMTEDADSLLWIGTTDNGLVCYNPSTKKFTSYTEKDGLPGISISSLLHVKGGKLWISTTNGIAVMDLHTKKTSSYSEEDGIISNDFNFKACAITARGELFWGTKIGVMSFFPDSLQENNPKGQLVITGTNIMGKDVYPADSVTLLQDGNMITLKFALLEHSHAKHYYRYRLSGFNENWNYANERNPSATYTNLPPGNYELQVNAAVSPGEWLTQTKSVFIVVKPAFWQTSWFLISGLLLLIGLVVFIPYSRIKKIIRREQEKNAITQKISELELSALQAQMNPHFIFNAIHSIQHFIIKNDEVNANEYLTKFANLMRLFLESSKRKFIPLAEELEILRLYTDLEKLRFEGKFEVVIRTEEELDINKTEIPSMLLQPFVENAIMHGLVYKKENGILLIELREIEEGLLCIIDDNGIGREASRKARRSKHSSRGIDLILDRVNSYNSLHGSPLCRISITDKTGESGQATGTRVEITIYYA